jgi:Tfp pilus assembly protein PilE
MFCASCGNKSLPESKFCSSCGLPGKDEKNQIDISVEKNNHATSNSNFHLYIGDKWNAYYAKVFHNIEQGKSSNWNTGAALVTFMWLLYRKLWLPAILYYFLSSILSAFLMATGNAPLIIIGFASMFILPGFYANKLVYARAKKVIKKSTDILPEARGAYLTAKGGTSNVAAWIVGLFVFVALLGILAAIALPAYQTYTNKVNIANSLSVFKAVGPKVSQYYKNHNAIPPSLSSVVNDAAIMSKENNVSYSLSQENGAIIAFYTNGSLANKTLYYYPNIKGDELTWTCYSDTIEQSNLVTPCKFYNPDQD